MPSFIFTFGDGHFHPVTGIPLNNRYVVLDMESTISARAEMCRLFGTQWCGTYYSEAEAGVYEFGLTELIGEEAKGYYANFPVATCLEPKTYFFHFKVGEGNATLALRLEGNTKLAGCRYGIAWCSPDDQFSRKQGRLIAGRKMTGRAKVGAGYFSFAEFGGRTFSQWLHDEAMRIVAGERTKNGPTWAQWQAISKRRRPKTKPDTEGLLYHLTVDKALKAEFTNAQKEGPLNSGREG